jgi:hypothetical protein
MEHRLEATGDEVFAPLVHEGWTDRIHGAPVRTGPDPVLTCAFKSSPASPRRHPTRFEPVPRLCTDGDVDAWKLFARDGSHAGGGDAPAVAGQVGHVPWGDPAPGSRLKGAGVGPTESPQNPDPQLTWFGLRHVFVLVEMTDHATALARIWAALANASAVPRPQGRRSTRHRAGLPSLGPESGARGVERSGPGAGRLGTGLDLRLRRLPNFSAASPATVGRLFRALVKVKMSTPGTCSPATPRMPAEETPPPSPDTALRSLEDLERAGPGAAGTGQARNSIARSRDPKARARCDPRAESLAGSLAGPMARSSSGGSSPVVRPAHGPRGVAG